MSAPTNEERNWLVEYRFNGITYVTTMYGRTQTEAKRKLIVAGTYGLVLGEVQHALSAISGMGVFVRFWTWLKNGGRQ